VGGVRPSAPPGSTKDLFERIVAVRNDVGLLSEEYDVLAGRMLGNFPQAVSNIRLINAARSLTAQHIDLVPARRRSPRVRDGSRAGVSR
jgi:hypothetical protein